MRTGIATLSLSGRLVDKLHAAAAAGFDGVEVFDNDLVGCPLPPREVRRLCDDLGLSVDLYQPVRDAVGVPAAAWPATRRRVLGRLDVAAELGAPVVLLCSHVGPDSVDEPELVAAQLRELGDAATERGLLLAYEALAWGTHVNRLSQSAEAVRRADHSRVTLAVDTFHVLARGDDAAEVRRVLADLPPGRIGFLQVADAPVMDMGLLEWSRHFRCFPGEGTLDVTGVVAATLDAGYAGPVSLEVFSDVVRESEQQVIADAALRSLLYLEDRLATSVSEPAAAGVRPSAPAPARVDLAFVEVADPDRSDGLPVLLRALGFHHAGDHRSKPVQWWRQGEAHLVVNRAADLPPLAHAVGLQVPDVGTVATRAQALRWPEVAGTRGEGEAPLPGVTAPSATHLFLSGDAVGQDWQVDFVLTGESGTGGWRGLDHVGLTCPPERLDEETGFLRGVLGLEPRAVEEFWEPQGRLRSRALRPGEGAARLVVNTGEGAPDVRRVAGVNQVAFACDDLLTHARALRERGVPLMQVPDNYYVDLAARTDLGDERVAELRAHGVLHDADEHGGELLQLWTDVLGTGFYVELLQRSGGYDGYGSRNTQLRLSAQQ